jgi:hypothetical protein
MPDPGSKKAPDPGSAILWITNTGKSDCKKMTRKIKKQ